MSTSLQLPPEILHAIATSYLSPTDDTSTLHALSLTHSFFLPSTRASLFHTIRLSRHPADDGVHPHLCNAFSGLLHQSPYIAGFVRKLIIIEGTIKNSWFGNVRYWVASEDEDLPFILRTVAFCGNQRNEGWQSAGLRSLEILGFGKATMNWSSLSPQLRSAFVEVVQQSGLEDLRLVGLNGFPLSVLRGSKALKNMCFGWMVVDPGASELDTHSIADSESEGTGVDCDRPELAFLDLSFEHHTAQGTALIHALTQPQCPIDISRVEHMVINGEQYPNIQQLLNYCPDLTSLEIRNNAYPIPAPPSHIDLGPLTSLHSLSLFLPMIDWDGVNPNPLPWLNYLLSTLRTATKANTTTNPSLHAIQLILDVDRIAFFDQVSSEEWSTLNSNLTRLLKPRIPYTRCNYNPHTPDIPDIIIYIFTDLDSYSFYDSPYSSISHNALLRDPPIPYVTTSCRCTKSGMCQKQVFEKESSNMRQFLTGFLPVLSTGHGVDKIRVYRINYIPRL